MGQTSPCHVGSSHVLNLEIPYRSSQDLSDKRPIVHLNRLTNHLHQLLLWFAWNGMCAEWCWMKVQGCFWDGHFNTPTHAESKRHQLCAFIYIYMYIYIYKRPFVSSCTFHAVAVRCWLMRMFRENWSRSALLKWMCTDEDGLLVMPLNFDLLYLGFCHGSPCYPWVSRNCQTSQDNSKAKRDQYKHIVIGGDTICWSGQ